MRLSALFLVLLVGLGVLLAVLAVAADQELNRDLALDLVPAG